MTESFRLRDETEFATHSDGGGYLVDLRSGDLFSLNSTAVLVVQSLAPTATLESLVRAVATAHPEVPVEVIRRDVRALLESLLDGGILERLDSATVP